MAFSDLTSFEKLIAPTIVKIVYWIGIVLIVISVIGSFIAAISTDQATAALLALVMLPFALLFWRILCELYIVVFGMYERLGAIRDLLARGPLR